MSGEQDKNDLSGLLSGTEIPIGGPSNMPPVPQNTPAFSSFSDRMMYVTHQKNRRNHAASSISGSMGDVDPVMVEVRRGLESLCAAGDDSRFSGEPMTRQEALKRIQKERIDLFLSNLEHQSAMALEQDALMSDLYSRRLRIATQESVEGLTLTDGPMENFWTTIFTNWPTVPVCEEDMPGLQYLVDIRCGTLVPQYDDIRTALSTHSPIPAQAGPGQYVDLYFSSNPYFKNKTLRISIRFDPEDPSSARWIESTEIIWGREKDALVSPVQQRPEGAEDDEEISATLFSMMDFFAGGQELSPGDAVEPYIATMVESALFFLNTTRRRILPNAALIYCGELHPPEEAQDSPEYW